MTFGAVSLDDCLPTCNSQSLMRCLRLVPIALALVVLSGCGGESSGPPPPPPPPPPPTHLPIQPTATAGTAHTCVLKSTGAVFCAGDNAIGELGNGSTVNSASMVPVSGAIVFATIAAGSSFTCGLNTDSSAYCW